MAAEKLDLKVFYVAVFSVK